MYNTATRADASKKRAFRKESEEIVWNDMGFLNKSIWKKFEAIPRYNPKKRT